MRGQGEVLVMWVSSVAVCFSRMWSEGLGYYPHHLDLSVYLSVFTTGHAAARLVSCRGLTWFILTRLFDQIFKGSGCLALKPKPDLYLFLAQVYRATLAGGKGEVAVKVQRPGVLKSVALDMFLIRQVSWWSLSGCMGFFQGLSRVLSRHN